MLYALKTKCMEENNIMPISENKMFADNSKKKWIKPLFEIISKDIIQSGTAPGAEGSVTPYSFHVHYS